MEQVEQTKDYSQFNFLKGNRKIDRHHLKKLKESIEKNNHLNLHPIIINSNFEIIDGQHRLEAAKQLNVAIFFIKSEIVKDDHLIESNVNQRSWEVENYIDYFSIKEKLPDYIELKTMMQLSGLKPKAILSMILGTISPEILNFMKTGKFIFPSNKDYEKTISSYLDFIAYVKDKRIKPISMFSNFYFTKAYRWLCLTGGFEYETLIKKLDLRWFDLRPQRNSEEWYKLLISIYNFKNHNRLEDAFSQ